MALPAKTSIRIDAILDTTLRNLEAARKNAYPITAVNGAITCLIEGLAHTLLSSKQQEQVQTTLMLWKECSTSGANPVENERPDVTQPHQV